MLHDARERYDVPVVEVIRPAVRRAVAATRNNQVGVISHPGHAPSHAYADSFAAAPQITVTSRPCPRFVEFVESGVTGGPELLSAAHEYLEPVAAQGVDTLILGLHPLPAADRRHLLRHGRRRDAGVLARRRPPRTSTGCWPTPTRCARTTCRRPSHEFVTTGDPAEFERLARRFLGPEVVQATVRDRGQPMRLTVVGCSGLAGRVRARRPPATSSAPSTRAAPGASCSTSATASLGALQRHVDLRDVDAVVISHLHPDHCVDLCGLYVAQRYDPRGPNPRPVPVHGPAGIADRMAARLRPATTPSAWAPSWTSARCGPRRVRGRPVPGHAVPGQPPGRGLRPAGRGRRTHCWPTPATPTAATALSPLCRDATLVLADSAFVDGRDAVEGIHLSGSRRGGGGRAGPGSAAADADPPAAVERPRRSAGPRPARSGPARSSWPLRTRPTSCSPAPGAGGHHLTLGA